jgi:hypothetical protein
MLFFSSASQYILMVLNQQTKWDANCQLTRPGRQDNVHQISQQAIASNHNRFIAQTEKALRMLQHDRVEILMVLNQQTKWDANCQLTRPGRQDIRDLGYCARPTQKKRFRDVHQISQQAIASNHNRFIAQTEKALRMLTLNEILAADDTLEIPDLYHWIQTMGTLATTEALYGQSATQKKRFRDVHQISQQAIASNHNRFIAQTEK